MKPNHRRLCVSNPRSACIRYRCCEVSTPASRSNVTAPASCNVNNAWRVRRPHGPSLIVRPCKAGAGVRRKARHAGGASTSTSSKRTATASPSNASGGKGSTTYSAPRKPIQVAMPGAAHQASSTAPAAANNNVSRTSAPHSRSNCALSAPRLRRSAVSRCRCSRFAVCRFMQLNAASMSNSALAAATAANRRQIASFESPSKRICVSVMPRKNAASRPFAFHSAGSSAYFG